MFFPVWLGAADVSAEVDSLIAGCIDATFMGEYDKAHSICDRLEELVDGSLAPFYRSAVLAGEMIDFEDTLGLGWFFYESQRCIERAQAKIKAGNHAADDYFHMGSTLAYQALFLGHQGQYWKAYKAALKSRKALERCLELDSTYVDALVGLGNFQYWMSKKLDVLNWLPVLRDEKEDGIAQLEYVMKTGARSKYLAISSLANIRLDQGEYMEALQLARLGKAKYPGSRVFLWQEGAAAFHLGLFTISNRIYEALLASVTSYDRNNHHNELSCYISMVVGYWRLKKYSTCIDLARTALELPLTDEIRNRKKKTIAAIKVHLEFAEQKIAQNR